MTTMVVACGGSVWWWCWCGWWCSAVLCPVRYGVNVRHTQYADATRLVSISILVLSTNDHMDSAWFYAIVLHNSSHTWHMNIKYKKKDCHAAARQCVPLYMYILYSQSHAYIVCALWASAEVNVLTVYMLDNLWEEINLSFYVIHASVSSIFISCCTMQNIFDHLFYLRFYFYFFFVCVFPVVRSTNFIRAIISSIFLLYFPMKPGDNIHSAVHEIDNMVFRFGLVSIPMK